MTSPQERSPNGSGRDESEQSSSDESGVYRFPKSNVSEIEARMREERGELPDRACCVVFLWSLVGWAVIIVTIGGVIWLLR